MKIVLKEDIQKPEDIAIAGNGSRHLKDVTGAITSVKLHEIQNLPGALISDALRGQITELNLTQSNACREFSGSSGVHQQFNREAAGNSTDPVIIINDIMLCYANARLLMDTFGNQDMSEKESMTILKDAATAIYETCAWNRAVVVESKREKMEHRYAELILNIVKYCGTAGNIASCYTYSGKLRNRAHTPKNYYNSVSDNSNNRYNVIAAYLNERQINAAYKGKRFGDIRGWLLYEGDSDFLNDNTCEKPGIKSPCETVRIGKLRKKMQAGKMKTVCQIHTGIIRQNK